MDDPHYGRRVAVNDDVARADISVSQDRLVVKIGLVVKKTSNSPVTRARARASSVGRDDPWYGRILRSSRRVVPDGKVSGIAWSTETACNSVRNVRSCVANFRPASSPSKFVNFLEVAGSP